VTTDLNAMIDRRLRRDKGHLYRDDEAARRWLRQTAERIRSKLPEFAAQGHGGGDTNLFEAALGTALAEQFPNLFEWKDEEK
jgi:hypothetical protein